MSLEIILIIVGIVLIILSILDNIKFNPKLRLPFGLLGIMLIIYGGYSYGAVNLQGAIEQPEMGNKKTIEFPVKSVQVLSPIEGDSVSCRILTAGVYPDSHQKDIWVVLRPSDDRYYPQSDHTNTSYKRNGEWQVITRFGGDKGELYEIIVYETDSKTSDFFSSTIADWKQANEYPGLEEAEIPTGAIEIERFDIFLKESCRGVH